MGYVEETCNGPKAPALPEVAVKDVVTLTAPPGPIGDGLHTLTLRLPLSVALVGRIAVGPEETEGVHGGDGRRLAADVVVPDDLETSLGDVLQPEVGHVQPLPEVGERAGAPGPLRSRVVVGLSDLRVVECPDGPLTRVDPVTDTGEGREGPVVVGPLTEGVLGEVPRPQGPPIPPDMAQDR